MSMSEDEELVPRVKTTKWEGKIKLKSFREPSLQRVLDDARHFPSSQTHITGVGDFSELGFRIIEVLRKHVPKHPYWDISISTENVAGLRMINYPLFPMAFSLVRYLLAHPKVVPVGVPPPDINLDKDGFFSIDPSDLRTIKIPSSSREPERSLKARIEMAGLVLKHREQDLLRGGGEGWLGRNWAFKDFSASTRILWHVTQDRGDSEGTEREGLAAHVALLRQPFHPQHILGFIQSYSTVNVYFSTHTDTGKIESWRIGPAMDTRYATNRLVCIIAMAVGWSNVADLFLKLNPKADAQGQVQAEPGLS